MYTILQLISFIAMKNRTNKNQIILGSYTCFHISVYIFLYNFDLKNPEIEEKY